MGSDVAMVGVRPSGARAGGDNWSSRLHEDDCFSVAGERSILQVMACLMLATASASKNRGVITTLTVQRPGMKPQALTILMARRGDCFLFLTTV